MSDAAGEISEAPVFEGRLEEGPSTSGALVEDATFEGRLEE